MCDIWQIQDTLSIYSFPVQGKLKFWMSRRETTCRMGQTSWRPRCTAAPHAMAWQWMWDMGWSPTLQLAAHLCIADFSYVGTSTEVAQVRAGQKKASHTFSLNAVGSPPRQCTFLGCLVELTMRNAITERSISVMYWSCTVYCMQQDGECLKFNNTGKPQQPKLSGQQYTAKYASKLCS